ncbi:MAG: helix-turn-helix transcriptional regulator [Candidatus Woesearchaeota archaeon]
MNHKKIVISALIIVSFILLILSIIFYIDKTRDMRRIDPLELESMAKEQIIQTIYERQVQSTTPFYYFIPMFGFFGIVVGALVYYIMSGDIERKEKVLVKNTAVVMQLLEPQERRVIKKILENQGKIQQIEITYMEGFTKVKAHRIIESLVQKGILEKEKLGKMRQLHMNKELYHILKDTDAER